MEEIKQKKGIKEFFRKQIVSLKKRTNKIPQFVMIVTFLVYALSLSTISNTTAYVNRSPMGLCSFVTMLLSVLAFVSSLRAFVPREKTKIFMVVVMYFMEAIIVGADIWYLIEINQGLANNTYQPKAMESINGSQVVIIIHLILVGLTVLLFALVPVMRKLLNKIDTSVDLGESEDMKKIELEDED